MLAQKVLGDGICQDHANNPECGFDLGDCCKPKSDKSQCLLCICWLHNFEFPEIGSKDCSHPKYIGNKVCNDHLNNAECGLDGFDCC